MGIGEFDKIEYSAWSFAAAIVCVFLLVVVLAARGIVGSVTIKHKDGSF